METNYKVLLKLLKQICTNKEYTLYEQNDLFLKINPEDEIKFTCSVKVTNKYVFNL